MNAEDAYWVNRHLHELIDLLGGSRATDVLGDGRRKNGKTKFWIAAWDIAHELARMFASDPVFQSDGGYRHQTCTALNFIDAALMRLTTMQEIMRRSYDHETDEPVRQSMLDLERMLEERKDEVYESERAWRREMRELDLSRRPNERPRYTEEECEDVRR